MAAESPTDQESVQERFRSYVGVDRWFREELAVGLGASYEAAFFTDPRHRQDEISEEAFLEAFFDGAEWAHERGRGRFADNPSKRAALDRTVWDMFSSEEQVAFMLDRFRDGKFGFGPITGLTGICLVGDREAFKFVKPEPEQQAA